MNITDRNFGSTERYISLLKEEMSDALFRYLWTLQDGRPDLSEALALARNTDGLIRTPEDCTKLVLAAVYTTCLASESQYRGKAIRAAARERLNEREVAVENLHFLACQLDSDTRVIDATRSDIERRNTSRQDLIAVVKAVNDAADAIERFIEGQRAFLLDKGGNRKGFDHLFVRKMRTVWKDITGKDPGIARLPVVKFSALIWTTFAFQRRSGDLLPWLAERFRKIR